MNGGKTKGAIAAAERGIASDPELADGYLIKGAVLQETGKWKDGVEMFNECVRRAKAGRKAECSAEARSFARTAPSLGAARCLLCASGAPLRQSVRAATRPA